MRTQALSTPAEEYLSWLAVERGRARNTLLAYRRDLAAYEQTLLGRGRRTPADADRDDVHAHLDRLAAAYRSPASVARCASAVRGLHRFMLDEGLAASDPTTDLAAPRTLLRLPKALTEGQVAALLSAPVGDTPAARRDRALLELLYGTGARISEIVGLDLAHVAGLEDPASAGAAAGTGAGTGVGVELGADDLGDLRATTERAVNPTGLLRLSGKGSKERMVPVGHWARRALAEWLAAEGRGRMTPARWQRRGDAEAVFLNTRGTRLSRQGAYDIVRKHALAAGLDARVSPHALRHSCATHMLAHGADIRVVQELLGHASVGTTQIYTKVTGEHLRRAYEAAHPRAGEP
ncbi:MAG: tyrosine-type recombinase/integrase [Actinomycetota bacterium]|nr:tyrosine-type recombinase/integrase [Actinomycetota bacterium]